MASYLTARRPVVGSRAVPGELAADFPEVAIPPVAADFPEVAILPVAVDFPEEAIQPVAVDFPEEEVVILVPCSAVEVRGGPAVPLLPA